jgi:very-short-patch-repair endonuclease
VGPYIADFARVRARLIVEVDGGTHGTDAERSHDARRDAFMRAHGWRVVRVWNIDVYEALDGVTEMIARATRERDSTPRG